MSTPKLDTSRAKGRYPRRTSRIKSRTEPMAATSDPQTEALRETSSQMSRKRPVWLRRLRLYRKSLSTMSFSRFLRGGQIRDMGRLPRYEVIFATGMAALWIPILAYMFAAPKQYTSESTLILPGTGVSTSLNLSDIGQATTSANSAYSSTTLSPSVTYKNLLESDTVLGAAADMLGPAGKKFGKPQVKLVDETSLITIKMIGSSPSNAQRKSNALLAAFNQLLDQLRDDEIKQRNASAAKTIRSYQESVDGIRRQINALELQSGLSSAEQYASIVAGAETLQTQIAETRSAYSERQGSAASLGKLLHISPQLAAATLKIEADEEMTALAEAAAKAASDAGELEKQYGPNHPKYIDAKAREAGLRARMIARGMAISGLSPDKLHTDIEPTSKGERPPLLSKLVTTVVEGEGFAAQLKAQTADLQARRQRIHDLVAINSRLDALNRDYKIADAVFASALARLDTSKADQFASYPMLQVLQPPTLATKPSAPNKAIATVAGFAASILLGLALLMSWMRRPIIDRIVSTVTRQDDESKA